MAYTTIDDPSAYFKVQLYTGNGSGGHAITFDDTDTNMSPNFVWLKTRSNSANHQIHTTLSAETYHYIRPNANLAQITSNSDALTAFNSDGFTIGSDGVINENTYTYVAWCWKESVTAGFDMLTYVGNHTSGRTVAHSLSAIPHMMLIKNLNSAEKPAVYHKGADSASPEDYLMVLSDTSARYDDLSFLNDTAPTSSVFTLGNTQGISEDGSTMAAFLWTSKQGFSKFSKFIGNGSTDGTFVYTGMRPSFIMLKRVDSTGGWYMYDNKRAGYNGSSGYLQGNDASAEDTNAGNFGFDILANGFKLKGSYATVNASGGTYIYMAFAEAPLVNSNGVPCNAR